MLDVDARGASRVARLQDWAFIPLAQRSIPKATAPFAGLLGGGSAPFYAKQPARCHGESQAKCNVGPMEMARHETFRFQRCQ